MSLGPLSKIAFEPTAELLAEIDNFGLSRLGEGVPKLFGYLDRAGRCRRIVADYANGGTLRINLDAKLRVTSTSFKISVKAKVRGGHAQG